MTLLVVASDAGIIGMPSPFPGMDPWLEAHWGDVWTSLVVYASSMLQRALAPNLVARIEERIFPAPGDDAGRDEPITDTYIKIRKVRADLPIITNIEFAAAYHKTDGEGRRLYRRRAEYCFEHGINRVEIDLVRVGTRWLPVSDERLPERARTPYRVWTHRSRSAGRLELYPIPLQQRLPVIPIPLGAMDPDVALDLQVLLEHAYETGGYEGDIDYSADPEPPLDPDDAAWADALLRERWLR